MPRWLFRRNGTRILECKQGNPGHKPSGYPSVMARSFAFYARLCRLCGCFLIRGLCDGNGDSVPRFVWKSWYTVYSCFCLAYLAWMCEQVFTLAPVVIQREPDEKPDHVIAYTYYLQGAVVVARTASSILCVSLGAPKLIDFYVQASTFEKTIRMPHCQCCTPKQFFWPCVQQACVGVLYCTIATLIDLTGLLRTGSFVTTEDRLKLALSVSDVFIGTCYRFIYGCVYFLSLNSASRVLKEYLEIQFRTLKHCISIQTLPTVDYRQASRCIESIRLNLFTICQLKEDLNRIWRWPLVISVICLLATSCFSLYVSFAAVDWTVRMPLFLKAAYLAYECAVLAYASQSLINTTKKIKSMCEAVRCADDDTSFRFQVQLLHACTNPEDMSLEGGDFFKIDLSLLISISATVITYGVILLQTN